MQSIWAQQNWNNNIIDLTHDDEIIFQFSNVNDFNEIYVKF